MLNPKTNLRELAYVVIIDNIEHIQGSDNCECAVIGGWRVMVRKDEFKKGDPAIYFEIDSYLDPSNPAFAFMEKKKYKVKTQRYTFGGKGNFISQGLLLSASNFGWEMQIDGTIWNPKDGDHGCYSPYNESRFLTKKLNVTYYVTEDNTRKANSVDKYEKMISRHKKLFSHQPFCFLIKHKIGRKFLFVLFGKKKDKETAFPTKFPFVKKTDQERVENMPWVLNNKTPFIITQKCDGSSGTYILERKKGIFGDKYEFYVCSRNVRQLTPDQKSYYDENYYWECAIKYDIENKLKDYLIKHPDLEYVCWQGEICSPKIQSNPHGLTETHLYCFHMIDSKKGKYDIREADKIWKEYHMEVVPIISEHYIMPDDFEILKNSADTVYSSAVCEGKCGQACEGFVYYNTNDPNFSFKNVSRKYLLK